MNKVIEIVLVDDEQIQLNHMRALVTEAAANLDLDISIAEFLSGEAFLFALEEHPTWDLAFLDIEMEKLNGMEVARIVREKAPAMSLVFATAYVEYALEGYEVQALDYLLKPIEVGKIQRVLERFLAYQPEEAEYAIFDVAGVPMRINLDDLLYAEASQREVLLFRVDKAVLSVSITLKEFTELVDERFISPHRSYVVNLQHVGKLLKQDVELTTGTKIPLSRRRAKDVQKAFIDFYKGTVFYDD